MDYDRFAQEPRKPREHVLDGVDYKNLPLDTLIDIQKVVVVTSMSRDTIRKKVDEGAFPQPYTVGNEPRWEWGEVRSWLHMKYEVDHFA